MENSVVFGNPIILIEYIIALVVCLFALIKKTHWAVSIFAVLVFVAVTTYALLSGASLYEIGAVAALFFAVHIFPLQKKGGE